jgi:outer membrane protein
MNKITRTLLALVGLVSATALFAQPALRVVVVDMARVYDTHYKTEEANAKFNDAAQRAQEQLDQLNKQLQTTEEEYRALMEESKSTIKNQQARDKAAADAQRKIEDMRRIQNDAQNFRVNTQRSLQQRAKIHRDSIMDEIMKVVNQIAGQRGATLVLDKSGPSVFGVPVVLHSDGAYDITEQVVKEVNKDRPAGTSSTGSASPASTLGSPVSSNATSSPGGFTVPGLSSEPKKP